LPAASVEAANGSSIARHHEEKHMTTRVLNSKAIDRPRPAVSERRRVWSANPAVVLWSTMVGKKVVMAVTGFVLVGFVVAHMLGNLKAFLGAPAIDAYAMFLRTMGEPLMPYSTLLWVVRIVLLASVALHITAAVQLTRLSWAARPKGYDTKDAIATTYAARTMRWGGVILVLFIIYHLLHLTAGVVGFQPGEFRDLAVHHNLVAGFSVWYVSLFYIVAMACLCLHLDHGIWSFLQTLGWSNARTTPALQALARGIALAVFLGFISVPVAVLAGWVR
jgi:succinate dehydrogenase cytochrome b subunit